jgi:transcription elongation factor Elf1
MRGSDSRTRKLRRRFRCRRKGHRWVRQASTLEGDVALTQERCDRCGKERVHQERPSDAPVRVLTN